MQNTDISLSPTSSTSSFWTVQEAFTYEKVIEKSRFIANVAPIDTEEAGRAFVAQIAKAHPFATHNCYAMIVDKKGQLQRFSDDGEPQGTAGLPMLEVLKNKKVYQIVVVVTRYFGGVKLGAGGLVRAYSGTVADALATDKLVECLQSQIVEFEIGYEQFAKLKNILQTKKAVLRNIDYQNTILVQVGLPLKSCMQTVQEIENALAGKLQYTFKEIDFLAYK